MSKGNVNAQMRRYDIRMRLKILFSLGAKCSRCGLSNIKLLQIDHKNSNGNKERKEMSHCTFYRRVLNHLEEYQLLCPNCNQLKRYEKGEGVSKEHFDLINANLVTFSL